MNNIDKGIFLFTHTVGERNGPCARRVFGVGPSSATQRRFPTGGNTHRGAVSVCPRFLSHCWQYITWAIAHREDDRVHLFPKECFLPHKLFGWPLMGGSGAPSPLLNGEGRCPPLCGHRAVKQGQSGGSIATTYQGKGRACREARIGQAGIGRVQGGERPMGTAAYRGNEFKERTRGKDESPIGAASFKQQIMPTPPPSPSFTPNPMVDSPSTHPSTCGGFPPQKVNKHRANIKFYFIKFILFLCEVFS